MTNAVPGVAMGATLLRRGRRYHVDHFAHGARRMIKTVTGVAKGATFTFITFFAFAIVKNYTRVRVFEFLRARTQINVFTFLTADRLTNLRRRDREASRYPLEKGLRFYI